MKTAVFLAAALAAVLGSPAWARRAPQLVELFTAQGCVSCNAANAVAAKLADRPDAIVITWPVDYWDYLGWKDTLAEPQFAERQRAYEDRLGLRDVYTPQIVVDGRAQASGDDDQDVQALLARTPRLDRPPEIQLGRAGRIAVGSGRRPSGGAEVWLIRFADHPMSVEVKAGDNRGAHVSETHVVRELVRLGRWTGRPALFHAPRSDQKGLRELVLVQAAQGGPILAAKLAPGDAAR